MYERYLIILLISISLLSPSTSSVHLISIRLLDENSLPISFWPVKVIYPTGEKIFVTDKYGKINIYAFSGEKIYLKPLESTPFSLICRDDTPILINSSKMELKILVKPQLRIYIVSRKTVSKILVYDSRHILLSQELYKVTSQNLSKNILEKLYKICFDRNIIGKRIFLKIFLGEKIYEYSLIVNETIGFINILEDANLKKIHVSGIGEIYVSTPNFKRIFKADSQGYVYIPLLNETKTLIAFTDLEDTPLIDGFSNIFYIENITEINCISTGFLVINSSRIFGGIRFYLKNQGLVNYLYKLSYITELYTINYYAIPVGEYIIEYFYRYTFRTKVDVKEGHISYISLFPYSYRYFHRVDETIYRLMQRVSNLLKMLEREGLSNNDMVDRYISGEEFYRISEKCRIENDSNGYQLFKKISVNLLQTLAFNLEQLIFYSKISSIILIIVLEISSIFLSEIFLAKYGRKYRIFFSTIIYFISLLLVYLYNPGFKTLFTGISFLYLIPILTFIHIFICKKVSQIENIRLASANISKHFKTSLLAILLISTINFSLIIFMHINLSISGTRSITHTSTNSKGYALVVYEPDKIVLNGLKKYYNITIYERFLTNYRKHRYVAKIARGKILDENLDEFYIDYIYSDKNDRKVLLKGVLGVDPGLELVNLSVIIIKGRFLSGDGDECIISDRYAEVLNIDIGDKIRVLNISLKVVGIFDSRKYANIRDLDWSYLRPENYYPSENGVILKPASPEGILIIPNTLAKKFKYSDIVKTIIICNSPQEAKRIGELVTLAINKPVILSINGISHVYSISMRYEFIGIETIIICVIAILLYGNFMLNIYSVRRREFLIYASIGFNPRDMMFTVLSESLIISSTGGLLGYLNGICLLTYLKKTGYQIYLYPPWGVGSMILTLLMGLLASYYPALKSSLSIVPSFIRRWHMKSKKGFYEEYLPVKISYWNIEELVREIDRSIRELAPQYGLNRIRERVIRRDRVSGDIKEVSYIIDYEGFGRGGSLYIDIAFNRLEQDGITRLYRIKLTAETKLIWYQNKYTLYLFVDTIRKTVLKFKTSSR